MYQLKYSNLSDEFYLNQFISNTENINIKDSQDNYIWDWILFGYSGKPSIKFNILYSYISKFNFDLWDNRYKNSFVNLCIIYEKDKLEEILSYIKFDILDIKLSYNHINQFLLLNFYNELNNNYKKIILNNIKNDFLNKEHPLINSMINIFSSNKKYSILDFIKDYQYYFNVCFSNIQLPLDYCKKISKTHVDFYDLYSCHSIFDIFKSIKAHEDLNKNNFLKLSQFDEILKFQEKSLINNTLVDIPINKTNKINKI